MLSVVLIPLKQPVMLGHEAKQRTAEFAKPQDRVLDDCTQLWEVKAVLIFKPVGVRIPCHLLVKSS